MVSSNSYNRNAIPKIAVVTVMPPRAEQGGAERLYRGLVDELGKHGVHVEQINVLGGESNLTEVLDTYLRFYDLDLSEYDGVISTKAPSYVLRHRNHVCYLPHTIRVFYDMFNMNTQDYSAINQRKIILALDHAAFSRKKLKDLYCVGSEVQRRLQEHIKVESKVLYHPSTLLNKQIRDGQYLFLPGRLHQWKRVELAIKAMRYMINKFPLVISGTGEDEERLIELARDIPEVSFVGYQSEEQLAELYAGALAVIFCPVREDYGLVTVEAFSSSKPVVTCSDSGEPSKLITHGYNGFVCDPSEADLAKHLDWLITNPSAAKTMGQQGFRSLDEISWKNVCKKLLDSLGLNTAAADL